MDPDPGLSVWGGRVDPGVIAQLEGPWTGERGGLAMVGNVTMVFAAVVVVALFAESGGGSCEDIDIEFSFLPLFVIGNKGISSVRRGDGEGVTDCLGGFIDCAVECSEEMGILAFWHGSFGLISVREGVVQC